MRVTLSRRLTKAMRVVSQNLLKRLANSVIVLPMLSHHRCSTEVA
ncbi:hypothetical protein F01_210160 [Burkholderia cenocepacia]|nr:hypothetical protein F01_210160 [Burkholderia cenocepacia]